jgi:CARDB
MLDTPAPPAQTWTMVMLSRRSWCVLGIPLLWAARAESYHQHAPITCPGDRYVVREGQILYGPAAPLSADAITFDTHVAIGSGCPAVPAHRRATPRGTRLFARWKSCEHLFGGAVLRARIDPSCQTMTGVFVGRRAKVRRAFIATRSLCGDGIFDPGAETCEGAAGCARGTCTSACRCVEEVTSTGPSASSTTTTTTTTAVTQITSEQPTTTTVTATTGTVPTSTTTGTLPGPLDFVPVSANMPATVTAGQILTLRWTVDNRSTTGAGPFWRDAVLFSVDAAVGDDTLIASTSWTLGLGAGASYTTAQPLTIPRVAAGDYFVLIRVDYLNNKSEGNEANNVLVLPVKVVAP